MHAAFTIYRRERKKMRMIGMVGVAMMMMLRRRMSRGERQQG